MLAVGGLCVQEERGYIVPEWVVQESKVGAERAFVIVVVAVGQWIARRGV